MGTQLPPLSLSPDSLSLGHPFGLSSEDSGLIGLLGPSTAACPQLLCGSPWAVALRGLEFLAHLHSQLTVMSQAWEVASVGHVARPPGGHDLPCLGPEGSPLPWWGGSFLG